MSEQQGFLFAPNAYGDAIPAASLAHADGPETSKEAAEQVVSSGRASLCREIVMDLLRANPGSTWGELWSAATSEQRETLREPQTIQKRLFDLMRIGEAEPGEERACRVRVSKAREWRAVKPT